MPVVGRAKTELSTAAAVGGLTKQVVPPRIISIMLSMLARTPEAESQHSVC
jgi:hypothetical protein